MAADILVALAFNTGLMVFSYGVGRLIVPVFGSNGPAGLRSLDRSLISLALGYGAITAIYLFLGLGDSLTEPAAWAVYPSRWPS